MQIPLVYLLLPVAVGLLLPSEADAWLSRLTKIFRRQRFPKINVPACIPTSGYDPASNWCYGTYCDDNGQAIAWDNFNCKTASTSSPTPPSTIPPSTTPSSSPPIITTPSGNGCFYEDQFYPAGTEISRGSDRGSNWCWVIYCNSNGHVLYGDDFNCFPTSSTSIPTPTGPPLTTQPDNVARRRR